MTIDSVVGLHPVVTDRSMPLLELATEAEARGLRSMYLPEHTHTPLGSEYFPDGSPQPTQYQHTLDPFAACAAVAAITSMEVGTAISLVAQHDAIALAKTIATIDHLSGGRFVLGVGYGYNLAEAENHGFKAADRVAVADETIALMRALWAHDPTEYRGRFRSVSQSWAWPKPARSGGVPVLLGVRATTYGFGRIAKLADGWIPMDSAPLRADGFAESLVALRRTWAEAGREGQPEVCCFVAPGTKEDMAAQLDRGRSLGVQRLLLFLQESSRDEILPVLDAMATLL